MSVASLSITQVLNNLEIDNGDELDLSQPNEVDLSEIITKEIGEDSQFNLLNADLVSYSFQGKMLEWFKEKRPEKRKEGVWLNAVSGKEFFDSIERRVNSLMSLGPSLSYSEKLQGYENKIFHIITPEKTISSAINVYSALAKLKNQKGFAQYNQDDSYIFMDLSTLLGLKTKKRVMDAFKLKVSHNLLIVDCKSASLQDQIQEVEELHNNLDEIASTKDNDVLGKKFASYSTIYKSEFDISGFYDLTKESQQKLLEREIILQGDKISLNKLIDKSDASTKNIIDVKTLIQLITNDRVEIGSKPPGMSDLEGAYSDLFEEVEIQTFIVKLLLKKLSDVYIISGMPGSDKEDKVIQSLNDHIKASKVNDLNSRMSVLNQQDIIRAINPTIQTTDDQFKEKDFKQICRNNPERKIY
ncbi:hypothetical protein ABEB36_014813 [Hypothenemus hampei]|uniref:Uncharacterized protein n=1 Tax=Hypothenemus hampei TaxID=57062 RepID=A0ABD1E5K6_HYPHA